MTSRSDSGPTLGRQGLLARWRARSRRRHEGFVTYRSNDELVDEGGDEPIRMHAGDAAASGYIELRRKRENR